jgi:hypothetical protein
MNVSFSSFVKGLLHEMNAATFCMCGKTSTIGANVLFGYSESAAVLPTGREIVCITQKVSGLTWLNFGPIFPGRAKKGPNSSTVLSLYFSL